MVHLPHLISDLALILIAAAVTTVIFKKLKQPLVLGYIIAGVIVGPHFPFFPNISEAEGVQTWAEIGVIFLLFGLGLEFSFKKLVRVGGASSITAITEVLCMLAVGYATGVAFGWSLMDSVFLGGILSISSTTIIIRAFDELGVKGKKFASLVFGTLVIEDLVAIVLLVLLSTLAISNQFAGTEMLYSFAKLVLFLVLWFVVGIFFLPTILRKWKAVMNNEMLLITAVALCLGMVVLATKAGFSPALGAFIMGSILAETSLGEKIEHLTTSVKDLFGAVFFVSVGMLIDPVMLKTYIVPIIIITLVTIVFKTLSTTIGALISGQPLKQSVQAGMSLSQIGEFSFIIATLGLSLKVTSSFLYPIAVAVSAITTFTTPYMIKSSGSFYNWLNSILPQSWRNAIERYSANTQTIKIRSNWRTILRANLTQLFTYSIIIFAVVTITSRYIVPAFTVRKDEYWVTIAVAIVTLIVLLPLFWALAFRKIKPAATEELLKDKNYRAPVILLQLLRIVTGVVLLIYLVYNMLSFMLAAIMLVAVVALLVLKRNKLQRIYTRLENRFITNLNEREDEESKKAGSHLTPWDAHISRLEISPYYTGIGATLEELQLREQLGVNIARIKRGALVINVPPRTERIFPGDIVYMIGTDEQIEALRKHMNVHSVPVVSESPQEDISLEQLTITKTSRLAGKTIRDSAIREQSHGLIVGIERDDERILNPASSTVLHAKDRLWIVGNPRRIKVLNERQ